MIRKHGKEFASQAELRRYEAGNKHVNNRPVTPPGEELIHEECYVRHTGKEGDVHVRYHRVWNRDRFIRALARGAAQVGGEAKVELITEGQYHRECEQQERKGARPDHVANGKGRSRK